MSPAAAVDELVESATEYGWATVDDFPAGVSEADATAALVAISRARLLDGLRTGAWLDTEVFPPLEWVLPRVIPEGSTLFVGPPKVGKSWFLLNLALATSCGGRVLGQEVPARPTLYLALEDGDRRMQDRCRRLLEGQPIPPTYAYLTRVAPGKLLATIDAFLSLDHQAPPFVIVDTLGKVMPPALMGESAYQRDYRIGSELKARTDQWPGSALVVCHHDRKAESSDFVDAVSGTNGLAGSADTIVVLSRARHETEGMLQVTGRDTPEGHFSVRCRDGYAWELVGPDLDAAAVDAATRHAAQGLADRSLEVLAYVNAHPDGVRPKDASNDLGIDDVRRYLARLAETGRIRRAERGLYTPVPTVPVSPLTLVDLGQGDSGDTHTEGTDDAS